MPTKARGDMLRTPITTESSFAFVQLGVRGLHSFSSHTPSLVRLCPPPCSCSRLLHTIFTGIWNPATEVHNFLFPRTASQISVFRSPGDPQKTSLCIISPSKGHVYVEQVLYKRKFENFYLRALCRARSL